MLPRGGPRRWQREVASVSMMCRQRSIPRSLVFFYSKHGDLGYQKTPGLRIHRFEDARIWQAWWHGALKQQVRVGCNQQEPKWMQDVPEFHVPDGDLDEKKEK